MERFISKMSVEVILSHLSSLEAKINITVVGLFSPDLRLLYEGLWEKLDA